jgi:hypothetical protein
MPHGGVRLNDCRSTWPRQREIAVLISACRIYRPAYFQVTPLDSRNDHDRLRCHPCLMISEYVTPMHHLMIMVSSAAPGRRR